MRKELEIRGKFENSEALISFMDKMNASHNLSRHRHRLSVIFTDKADENIDVQVRTDGLTPQMIVKTGNYHGRQRQETEISLHKDTFLQAVKFCHTIGLKNGVVAEAEDWFYQLDNIELKVSLCDEVIHCWELEAMDRSVNSSDLAHKAEELGLSPMSEYELREYWTWMKEYANRSFDIHKISDYYKSYVSKVN